MNLGFLPGVNAVLNLTSAVLLFVGWRLIRAGRIEAHRRAMLAACTTSTLFLISYLTYHAQMGSTRFLGQGSARVAYFAILGSHIVLAAAVVPLALTTLVRALRGRFDLHRAVARWTLPIWLYVSVTGVVVYAMLYHLYPHAR